MNAEESSVGENGVLGAHLLECAGRDQSLGNLKVKRFVSINAMNTDYSPDQD